MSVRRIVIPIVALAVAGGAALYVKAALEGQQVEVPSAAAIMPTTEAPRAQVLVAAELLQPGGFIRPEHVRWQAWPTDDLPKGFWVEEQGRAVEELVGSVVRGTLVEGQPIQDQLVIEPGSRGFLAAVLEPNMRAVSVAVNEASSNAGLIFPGDHVDLILTQSIPLVIAGAGELGDGTIERAVSETVLRDVRVIAMGQRLSDARDDEASAPGARTSTLEVSPRQAEVVVLVAELGKLSLSLRGVAADDGLDFGARSAPTWEVDVSTARRQTQSGSSSVLTVIRGRESEQVPLTGGNGP